MPPGTKVRILKNVYDVRWKVSGPGEYIRGKSGIVVLNPLWHPSDELIYVELDYNRGTWPFHETELSEIE